MPNILDNLKYGELLLHGKTSLIASIHNDLGGEKEIAALFTNPGELISCAGKKWCIGFNISG